MEHGFMRRLADLLTTSRRGLAPQSDRERMTWDDLAHQNARRERLRAAIDSLEDVTPCERELLMQIGTAIENGKVHIITNMPPQHPQYGPGA